MSRHTTEQEAAQKEGERERRKERKEIGVCSASVDTLLMRVARESMLQIAELTTHTHTMGST